MSILLCVDFPDPSPPSKEMKTPACVAPVIPPSSPRKAIMMSDHKEMLGRSFIRRYETMPTVTPIIPAPNIVNAAPLYETSNFANLNVCRPIAAATAGAMAKTPTKEIRISDCTKAKVRPRTSSSTSSPNIVKPVTHERPAKAPNKTTINRAKTRFVTIAKRRRKTEEMVSDAPKVRRRENCPKIFGPREIPKARPRKTAPNKTP